MNNLSKIFTITGMCVFAFLSAANANDTSLRITNATKYKMKMVWSATKINNKGKITHSKSKKSITLQPGQVVMPDMPDGALYMPIIHSLEQITDRCGNPSNIKIADETTLSGNLTHLLEARETGIGYAMTKNERGIKYTKFSGKLINMHNVLPRGGISGFQGGDFEQLVKYMKYELSGEDGKIKESTFVDIKIDGHSNELEVHLRSKNGAIDRMTVTQISLLGNRDTNKGCTIM